MVIADVYRDVKDAVENNCLIFETETGVVAQRNMQWIEVSIINNRGNNVLELAFNVEGEPHTFEPFFEDGRHTAVTLYGTQHVYNMCSMWGHDISLEFAEDEPYFTEIECQWYDFDVIGDR
jgi:hypothetical protein